MANSKEIAALIRRTTVRISGKQHRPLSDLDAWSQLVRLPSGSWQAGECHTTPAVERRRLLPSWADVIRRMAHETGRKEARMALWHYEDGRPLRRQVADLEAARDRLAVGSRTTQRKLQAAHDAGVEVGRAEGIALAIERLKKRKTEAAARGLGANEESAIQACIMVLQGIQEVKPCSK